MTDKKDAVRVHEVEYHDNNLRAYAEDHVDDPTMNAQPLEVYMYYAAIERAREDADPRPVPDAPWTVAFKLLTGRRSKIVRPHEPESNAVIPAKQSRLGGLTRRFRGASPSPVESPAHGSTGSIDDKHQVMHVDDKHHVSHIETSNAENGIMGVLSESERQSAYRLLRVTSWQVVFFLIMTDVLGWYTAPMAFAMLGYGPGVLVYTFFYLLAFCSGQILWRMYLSMDSEKYPVKCYADLGERTYGPICRHLFNALQSVQLLFNTAMLIIMDGQALAAIISFKFCYIGLTVLFAALGALLAQIKTMRSLGVFTCINLFVNLIVMITCMVGVGMYPPIAAQSGHEDLSEPKQVSAWVPGYTLGWYQQVVGVQLAVFAYGGAMIFTEFMAEMRKPREFWKSALGAQFLCYSLYMIFGIFVYSEQGQYTNILPTVNIDNIPFQAVTNILGLISITVIAVLYSHVGCKVFYRNILRGYLRAPSLSNKQSKSGLYWSALVITYWTLAWVIGSAIPNITDLNTVVGASCILQFTYTFPSALLLGHWVQRDALAGDRPWEPGMQPWSNRVDTWRDLSRWKRGFKPYWYAKVLLICIVLGALSLAGLGIYSGVLGAQESFSSGFTTSFSCRAPGQPTE